ncbi:MAG TPA: N-acetylneuraminate synthase family protein [Anaerolineae bacterium]|nr:N-acetylneuraminate synthase family protein [Anaerolineae bacterium]
MAVTIIAEVGSNWGGKLDHALDYVEAAAMAGADVVKFQTIRVGQLYAGGYEPKFVIPELPDDWHFELKARADKLGIEFMSTPFYLGAVDLLERVGVKRYKIASGDITFRPLLQRVAETGKPLLLSTGACGMNDIREAAGFLKWGCYSWNRVTLLHCVTRYPAPVDEMGLQSMRYLRDCFGCPVGLSDHSLSNAVSIAAVGMGASVIEKHITLDRRTPGPDHPFATTVEEFADLVRDIRAVEAALGNYDKTPSPSEQGAAGRIRRNPSDWLRPEVRG